MPAIRPLNGKHMREGHVDPISRSERLSFHTDGALAADAWRTDDLSGFTARISVPAAITAVTTSFTPSLLPHTVDNVADDISTTRTLVANGAHIVSTIDAPNDQDFYKIQLVAGQSYEIGVYAKTGGPSLAPLPDALVELYDANGDLLDAVDGGGRTTGGELYGLDALLVFTAQYTGTYYVNARGYDQSYKNGGNGDNVGDYEVFVDAVTTPDPGPPPAPRYYAPDNPLYAIDWGTQVDGSSRNPDGEEGPRLTGNPETGYAWNPFGITEKNVITYYFAKQGEVFIDEDPTSPGTTDTMVAKGFEDWEKAVYLSAFGEYSKVADIVYVEVDDKTDANFILITYVGTPGLGAPSLLGRMSPPNEENEGRTEFNANDERWTPEGLAPGGFSFTTLIHEFGHGHGLAHPHDTGGGSGIMRGVYTEGPAFDHSRGAYGLNQSVYTMMSYNDGWETSPYGQPATQDPYGWLGSLMAFDIAAIQDKYGVNEEWATGDDTYVIRDENAPGTFYSCIWDAAGTDEIVYDGVRDAVIDLNAATLRYERGGGGNMSYADGIFGGFTIANGVTIENASTGGGDDRLVGNAAANRLSAGNGDDVLLGGAGNDVLIGGHGRDILDGGAGADILRFESADDSKVGAQRDLIAAFQLGSDRIDVTALGATTFIGSGQFHNQSGEVRAVSFSGATIVEIDGNGDGAADSQIELDRSVQLSVYDFVGLAPYQPPEAPLVGGGDGAQLF